ncbi:unnamed protein product, partial [Iphiclides podalirius]
MQCMFYTRKAWWLIALAVLKPQNVMRLSCTKTEDKTSTISSNMTSQLQPLMSTVGDIPLQIQKRKAGQTVFKKK